MSEIEDMKALVAVFESGGFGRAAAQLGVSKSVVSRRISSLEAELGVRLLSRTTRGINPTEAGLEFKLRSESILAAFDEARDAVAELGGGVSGRLRVSVPALFGRRHLTAVFSELAERHPRLGLDISFEDRIVDLIGERFDAAVRIGTLNDSSLVVRRIAPARSVVVASLAYISRHGRPASPSDLSRHDCLIYTGSTSSDWHFRSGKRTIAVRPSGRLHARDGEAIMEWAAAGLGVAHLPTFMVSEAVEGGVLEPLLLDYPAPEFGIHVVRPPGAYTPGKVRVFIDALVERFGGQPSWDRCVEKASTPA